MIGCPLENHPGHKNRDTPFHDKALVIVHPISSLRSPSGICQDTSKKLVRSLFIPEEPQQGLCPYASLPQDIF